MSAPTAPVEICSLALEYLSDVAITSIDDPQTTPEHIMARWYDMTRRSLLRQHPWNFAIRRTNIARESADPAFGYTDAYTLPNDFLRFIEIKGYDGESDVTDYEIEDGQLLCNNSGGVLYIRYVYDATLVGKFDSLFVDVLALELAMRCCRKVTGSNDLIAGLKEILKDIKADAQTIDGQERPPRRVERSKWKAARARAFSGSNTAEVTFP